MKHSEKPAGLTLAEALGIELDDKQVRKITRPVVLPRGVTRSESQEAAQRQQNIEYDGFTDTDGFGS